MKEVEPQKKENVLDDGNNRWDAENLIEQIWHDLGGTTPRCQIRSVFMEVAPSYEDARIMTYVPILLRAKVLRRLQDDIEMDREAKSS